MFGTATGDEKAVKALEEIIRDVAPGWAHRGFRGDFLDTAVLENGNGQIEVKLQGVGESGQLLSGRAMLEYVAGDARKRAYVENQILKSLKNLPR